jgi:Stage II sporulation protein E (SpoIIE)
MQRAVWALFLLLLPLAAPAQSLITIAPQQCVWHAGDDPAWSAPTLDESGWRPYSEWNLPNAPLRYWVRCHADLSFLRSMAHPAIQFRLFASLQIFVNGDLIGSAGDLRDGSFDMNTVRSFQVPQADLNPPITTIAIRTAFPNWAPSQFRLIAVLTTSQLKIDIGDAETLRLSRSDQVFASSSRYLPIAACYEVIGVVAIMLLGLWLYDRSHGELLLLGTLCLFIAALRLNEFCAATMWQYPFRTFIAVYLAGNLVAPFAQTMFFFTLARRRMPLLFWIFCGYVAIEFALEGFEWLFGIGAPVWQNSLILNLRPFFAQMARLTAPLVAFWPLWRIPRRMRLVAGLCIILASVDLLWFGIQATSTIFPIPGVPKLYELWRGDLLEARALITACVLTALLALLFREQRQVTEDRAILAGEVQAARSVQQYLIPEHLPQTQGITIKSEYHPARDVGGDFFQVLPQSDDGSLLVVIGDVAGKGVEAGMLATLIVGAVRTAAAFTSDPARILTLLNERLNGRGLVTCLALRIERNGSAALVNAGHLPPYLNGKELALDGALPLGAVSGISFPVSLFRLAEGDTLILMTDGVAEAQDARGQLFGFERVGDLLNRGANGAALAEAAQQFGQQDDITVLTLTRQATGSETLREISTPILAQA